VTDLNLKQDRIINYAKSNKEILQVKSQQTNLLTLAQNNNINANFGCGIGVCHECKCKKLSGIVFNTKTQIYSDNGEEDIQLCISVPITHVSLRL
jgi:ferredoxin